MPIKVKAQGKTFTFPDGTSQDQIAEAIDSHFKGASQPKPVKPRQIDNTGLTPEQQAELAAKDAQFKAEQQQLVESNTPNPLQSLAVGAGKGLTDVGRFFTGLVGAGPDAGQVQAEQREFDQLKETNPVTSRVGEFLGETVGTAPLGGIAGSIGKNIAKGTAIRLGATAGGRAATTAGTLGLGAAEGAAVATQLGEDATTGAALGAGAGVLMPVVFKAGKSAFSRLTGREATEEIFDQTTGELTESAAKELRDAGIPVETFTQEIEKTIKNNFQPEVDLAVQARKSQLEEFAPDVESRPSRLAQDISAQNAEESLIALGTPEGRSLLTAERSIQEGLEKGAQERLLGDLDVELISKFSTISDDANKGLMGASAKEALSEIKIIENERVRDLYKSAIDIAGDGQQITSTGILNAFETGANDFAPSDGLMGAVGRALKEYNVIPDGNPLAEEFSFKAPRELKDLTLDNAERLRQRLNKLDPNDGSQDSVFIGVIRQQLDNQVNDLIDAFPEEAAAAKAFKEARNASANFKRTFNEKRLVSDLIGFKKGSDVDKIAEEKVVDVMLKSSEKSIKQIKSLMLENPTPASKKAWNEMKFTVIDEILRGSMDKQVGVLSGQRLNTSLTNIADSKLKLILGNEKFNQLKRFQQVLSDQTVPLKRLENPAGTSGPLMGMLGAMGDLLKGSADASTGGLITQASKASTQRKAIEQSMKDIQTATGQTGRVKRLKAQKQIAEFLKELSIVGAATTGNDE